MRRLLLLAAAASALVDPEEVRATTSCRVVRVPAPAPSGAPKLAYDAASHAVVPQTAAPPPTHVDQVVCFPRVLVLGAARTGTTALFEFLVKHRAILPPGPKENKRVCELTEKTARLYEEKVGENLAATLERKGNAIREPLVTLEAATYNLFCPGPLGLDHRAQLMARTFRPRAIVLHREPLERLWSEYKYFGSFNPRCDPSPARFVDLVGNQTAALLACRGYWAQWLDGQRWGRHDCDAELANQLSTSPPHYPCGHLARVVPGLSHYFEARWRRALGDKHVHAVTSTELRRTRMGPRLWSFLNLTYVRKPKTPDLNGRVEPKSPRPHPKGAAFLEALEGVGPPEAARARLAAFHADFDPRVLDALI